MPVAENGHTTLPPAGAMSRRAFFAGGAAIGVAGVATPALAHPDAHLLALGERLTADMANEDAARDRLGEHPSCAEEALYERVVDRTAETVDAIIALPATTFAGLQVKARAIDWCNGGEPCDLGEELGGTMDVRLIGSIVADLLAG